MKHLPIGILDSGIGGLTVMREIQRLLPQEDLLYFADTAHFPYGEKSPEEIVRYTDSGATFLHKKGIKLLLLACHTASCYALSHLKTQLPIPVLGMIEPSLHILKEIDSFALMGTTRTIQSRMYPTLLPSANIFPVNFPSLAALIENNLPLENAIHRDLVPLSTLFLACTHYPFISPLLRKIFGTPIQILDPGRACAQLVQKTLSELHLQNPHVHSPRYEFFTSAPANISFKTLLQKLEEKIEIVK